MVTITSINGFDLKGVLQLLYGHVEMHDCVVYLEVATRSGDNQD